MTADECKCTVQHTKGCEDAKANWLRICGPNVGAGSYSCKCGTGLPPNCHRLEECPRAWREQLLRAWESLPDYIVYSLSRCGYPELERVADCELCRRGTKYRNHDINVMSCAAAARAQLKRTARKAFYAGWDACLASKSARNSSFTTYEEENGQD